jgi:hypothetical protein
MHYVRNLYAVFLLFSSFSQLLCLQIMVVLGLSAILVNCRPEDPRTDTINVQDTDDEFIIKKPDTTDPAYNEFIDELYKHDENKKPKSKRNVEDEEGHVKLTVESPKEFEIPVKPESHTDENYDQFLSHLYRHDELKRSRRMIVFRHDS